MRNITLQSKNGKILFWITGILLLALAWNPSFAQSIEEGLVIGAEEGLAGLEAHTTSPKDIGQALLNFATYGTYNPDSVTTPSVAGTVARALNLIGLVIMAALAVLGGVTFTIHTANKGVPGGQIISSFWMPIRVSVSTIMLVPLTLGFSTIQLGVNKIAETGNNHGSWVSGQVVDHLRGFGAYAPPFIKDSRVAMQGLITAEACMLYINSQLRIDRSSNPTNGVTSNVRRTSDGMVEIGYDFQDPKRGVFGRKAPEANYCGAVRIKIPDSMNLYTGFGRFTFNSMEGLTQDEIAEKFITAMRTEFIPNARGIAETIFADQVSLRTMQRTGSSISEEDYRTATRNMGQSLQSAAKSFGELVSKYNAFVQRTVTEAVNNQRDKLAGASWDSEIKECGWVCLGTIYWQTSKSQEYINGISSALTPTIADLRIDKKYINDERFSTLQDRIFEINALYEPAEQLTNSGLSEIVSIQHAGAEDPSSVQKWFALLSQGMAKAFILDENADFVNQMQKSGQLMAGAIDLAYHSKVWTIAMATTAYNLTTNLANASSGTPLAGTAVAVKMSLVGAALDLIKNLAQGYGDLFDTIIMPLMFASFLLAIVLPAIPLFLWLMGVASWLIFYIECLLVSPIWMSAHGTAEKEGWGSEHTRQGYMLMIGLYLNPILRVAGFAMILVIIYPLGVLAGLLSSYLVGVLMSGVFTSPLMLTGAALLLAFFAYSLAVRVFSLPNELFERGLRWVNGGQEVTGDENASNRINAMVATFGTRSSFNTGLIPRARANAAPPRNQ